MNFIYSDEPIIACSTNNSVNSAIAVIRLSGFKDLSFLNDIISIDTSSIKRRYAHFCSLIFDNKKIDDIVLTYFEGPNSYNGENILELGVHGNIINVENIIELFITHKKFRRAAPGEFSYRAYKNGKLSLSQVEGLDLLLNANSQLAIEQGNSLLGGDLNKSYNELYKAYLNHKSSVELSIDFLDDVGEEESSKQLNESSRILLDKVQTLKNFCTNKKYNLLAPDICLLGKPNSGKSSLFNSLLGSQRAIVSDIKGTTRDYIKENLLISKINFSLIDTAGIRNTNDEIEEIGIEKALKIFKDSFYKILLVNPFEDFDIEIDFDEIDFILFTHKDVNGFNEKTQALVKKIGSMGANLVGPMGAKKDGSIGPKNAGPIGAKPSGSIEPKKIGSMGAILYDYSNNNDVGELKNVLSTYISEKFNIYSKNNPIIIDRHIDTINNIYSAMHSYLNILSNESDISIISSELNIVGDCISELIGIVSPDSVLHNIFDNFCIGK
ncbi:MAG: 50S ribosome-binding GTPase [Bacteriovoracaceae bacterium]|jgi:tRNA modification GTPase|nr:50S ribosome-binding GTPase [Bacteriovoracaceae bacterium]